MNQARPSLLETVVKTAVTHTVTYFIMGLLASTLLDTGLFLGAARIRTGQRGRSKEA